MERRETERRGEDGWTEVSEHGGWFCYGGLRWVRTMKEVKLVLRATVSRRRIESHRENGLEQKDGFGIKHERPGGEDCHGLGALHRSRRLVTLRYCENMAARARGRRRREGRVEVPSKVR